MQQVGTGWALRRADRCPGVRRCVHWQVGVLRVVALRSEIVSGDPNGGGPYSYGRELRCAVTIRPVAFLGVCCNYCWMCSRDVQRGPSVAPPGAQ
jgi:hypothetical protein